jgi:tetratricopeptide (TPR) repeat protein
MNIETGIKMRESGDAEKALGIFKQLLETDQKNPDLHYQIAWCLDVLGREKEAVGSYEKAIETGINDKDLIGVYLGLGSTYRTIGEYEKSLDLFDAAIERFPEYNEYRVFRAMTNYNLGNYCEAMRELLVIIADFIVINWINCGKEDLWILII